jgi:putative DNA primase/helicase
MMTELEKAFEPLSEEELSASKAESPDVHKSEEDFKPIVPPPDESVYENCNHYSLGQPTHRYAYRNEKGELEGFICRYETSNTDHVAGKEIRPLRYGVLNGKLGVHSKGWGSGRPLYGLPNLIENPDKRVLVVEGEKTADAAIELFPDLAAVTSMGGAESACRSDWSKLAGRDVVIWPDNDQAGQDFANDVASLVSQVGALKVAKVLVPDSFPKGWDLADEPPGNWNEERVINLIDSAEVVEVTVGGANELKEDYPFSLTEKGVFKRVITRKGEIEWLCVCSPLEVIADTRNSSGEDWGRVVRVRDREGRSHDWSIPMAMFAGDSAAYRSLLFALGLEMPSTLAAKHALHDYIVGAQPPERVLCVDRIGWHGDIYVLPDEAIGPEGDEQAVLQRNAPFDHAFKKEGLLEVWKDEVASLCQGNTRLVLALCISLAASIVRLMSAENGGFHFRGSSSIGKTTSALMAASAWGGGTNGYIRTWRATSNALEGTAVQHCDCILILDEISQVNPREVGQIAYMLANGIGKLRAKSNASTRKTHEWRLMFLSTGEMGLSDKAAEVPGQKLSAGQQVRVIDLQADAGAGFGLFEDLHGFDGGDEFARHISKVSSCVFGTAGPAFVRAIIEDKDAAVEIINECRDDFVELYCPEKSDGQVQRVANRFGLVAAAGEFAIELGILPWPKGEAIEAALACFRSWLDERGGTEPTEVRDGIAQVQSIVAASGESRFQPMDPYSDETWAKTSKRLGFRDKNDDGDWEYFVFNEMWKSELCRGFNPKMTARELAKRGMLKPGSGGKNSVSKKLPGHEKSVRVYHLTSKILGEEDSEPEDL